MTIALARTPAERQDGGLRLRIFFAGFHEEAKRVIKGNLEVALSAWCHRDLPYTTNGTIAPGADVCPSCRDKHVFFPIVDGGISFISGLGSKACPRGLMDMAMKLCRMLNRAFAFTRD